MSKSIGDKTVIKQDIIVYCNFVHERIHFLGKFLVLHDGGESTFFSLQDHYQLDAQLKCYDKFMNKVLISQTLEVHKQNITIYITVLNIFVYVGNALNFKK